MSQHPEYFIFQGEAGDCWFLSSLCSFANYVTKKKEEGNDDELLDRVVQSKFQLAGDRGLFCRLRTAVRTAHPWNIKPNSRQLWFYVKVEWFSCGLLDPLCRINSVKKKLLNLFYDSVLFYRHVTLKLTLNWFIVPSLVPSFVHQFVTEFPWCYVTIDRWYWRLLLIHFDLASGSNVF